MTVVACPSRAPHEVHEWKPKGSGWPLICEGVAAPVEDTWWLDHEPDLPRDPFHGIPPVEVWLMFAAQLAGVALALLCALVLPQPLGVILFVAVNAALAANIARVLLRRRR